MFPTTSWMELSTLLDKVGERLKRSQEKVDRLVVARGRARPFEAPDTVSVHAHFRYGDVSVLRVTLIPEGRDDAAPHV